jgi:hypothetical protein
MRPERTNIANTRKIAVAKPSDAARLMKRTNGMPLQSNGSRWLKSSICVSTNSMLMGRGRRRKAVILTIPVMKKFSFVGAALLAFSWIADAKDFPIVCSIVESTDAGDKTGEKLGITYDGFVAKLGDHNEWILRHGDFATAFKNSPDEMKWLGYVHGNRGLDTTIRLVAVWTKNGLENGSGGYVSTYVETIDNGKHISKLMSECEQNQ